MIWGGVVRSSVITVYGGVRSGIITVYGGMRSGGIAVYGASCCCGSMGYLAIDSLRQIIICPRLTRV